MSQNTLAVPTHSRPVLRMQATPLRPQLVRSGSMRLPAACFSPGIREFTHAARCEALPTVAPTARMSSRCDSGSQTCPEMVSMLPGTRE